MHDPSKTLGGRKVYALLHTSGYHAKILGIYATKARAIDAGRGMYVNLEVYEMEVDHPVGFCLPDQRFGPVWSLERDGVPEELMSPPPPSYWEAEGV